MEIIKKQTMENQTITPVLNTKEWIITILIASLPVIGLVMLFVWAFSDDTNPNKANWAKARLIWCAIGIVFCLLLISIFGTTLLFLFQDLPTDNF